MRLLPRQEKFFAFFLSQARIITEASLLLSEGVRAGDGKLSESVPKIKLLEQQGDEIIHEVFTKLNQTFITPIDPEDIHGLASYLDDVLDCIEDAAHRMTAYRVDPIPPAVVELCDIIQACAKALSRAFESLEKNGPRASTTASRSTGWRRPRTRCTAARSPTCSLTSRTRST